MANPSQVEVGQGGATGATASSAVPPSTTFASEAQAGSSPGAPGSLGAGFKDTAKTATDAIRQQAAQFAGEVGRELGKTGESQKARGVDALKRFARAIDGAARELEPQSAAVAGAVHEAARKVDGLSDNLSNRDVNELIESAAQLARAQPVLFLGGSVAAGFALARFLKSSSRQGSRTGA